MWACWRWRCAVFAAPSSPLINRWLMGRGSVPADWWYKWATHLAMPWRKILHLPPAILPHHDSPPPRPHPPPLRAILPPPAVARLPVGGGRGCDRCGHWHLGRGAEAQRGRGETHPLRSSAPPLLCASPPPRPPHPPPPRNQPPARLAPLAGRMVDGSGQPSASQPVS